MVGEGLLSRSRGGKKVQAQVRLSFGLWGGMYFLAVVEAKGKK